MKRRKFVQPRYDFTYRLTDKGKAALRLESLLERQATLNALLDNALLTETKKTDIRLALLALEADINQCNAVLNPSDSAGV